MPLNDPNRAPPDQKIWFSWVRAPLSMALMAVAFAMALSTWLITRTANHAVDRMGDFLIPQVNSTTVLGGSVSAMRSRLNLTIEEADITAEVTRSESYTWWKIYLGTTTARVRATGCHIEYIIPLESFGTSDIEAIVTPEGKRIVRVVLPEPIVNEHIVEVDYNHFEVEAASGWARFNKEEVADEAKVLLRQAAIEQGKKPWHITAVKVDAEPQIRQLLESLIHSLRPDVSFEVAFREKP